MRRRSLPVGTVGERMGRTSTPFSMNMDAALFIALFPGIITDWMQL
jgi:hypothetical protein